jgi:hypothetical protein
MKTAFAFLFAALAMASPASATVVTFDDLGSDQVVPNGYGGINWNGNWTAFQDSQPPYTPESPPFRIFDREFQTAGEDSFNFVTPSVFNGAYFAGNSFAVTGFQLFNGATLVWTSGTIAPTGTPAFLASGYNGLVTEVDVVSTSPDFFVMDDVTYNMSATPLPTTWTMLIAGFAALAFFAFRGNRKGSAAIAAA